MYVQRLFTYVTINKETNCYEWKGSKSKEYGQMNYRGRMQLTHRLSYAFSRGIPMHEMEELRKEYKLIVMHKCDNPICINPEHLRLGSLKDNQNDSVSKNRNNNQNSIRTHCRKGHLFNAKRKCTICRNEYARNRYHRKKNSLATNN